MYSLASILSDTAGMLFRTWLWLRHKLEGRDSNGKEKWSRWGTMHSATAWRHGEGFLCIRIYKIKESVRGKDPNAAKWQILIIISTLEACITFNDSKLTKVYRPYLNVIWASFLLQPSSCCLRLFHFSKSHFEIWPNALMVDYRKEVGFIKSVSNIASPIYF